MWIDQGSGSHISFHSVYRLAMPFSFLMCVKIILAS